MHSKEGNRIILKLNGCTVKLTIAFCDRYFETKQLYCETEQLHFETGILKLHGCILQLTSCILKLDHFSETCNFETPKVPSPPDHQPSVRTEDSVFLPLPRFQWERGISVLV